MLCVSLTDEKAVLNVLVCRRKINLTARIGSITHHQMHVKSTYFCQDLVCMLLTVNMLAKNNEKHEPTSFSVGVACLKEINQIYLK